MNSLKVSLFTAAMMLFGVLGFAQNVPGYDKCIAQTMLNEAIANDPSIAAKRAVLENLTEQYVNENYANYLPANKNAQNRSASVVKIIPVVFHVVHEGGPENVDRSQLLSAIDVLNQDFRRLNADTGSTPAVFKPIAADSEIEFRMATLDPNGNCTDGVTRTYSSLTNQTRNEVKSLVIWPSNMYLNIWIVKSIRNVNGTPGTVIGFSQFPGGDPNTDGVVLVHDFTGTTGTAANNGDAGRTITHEVGHWFNLYHIWGDDNGACTGSDQVLDTPNQADMHLTTCPTWPTISCSNGPNGDLYPDYMDYTRGNCMNIFTAGQAARMNAALNSDPSRVNLWQSGNLVDTGTNGVTGQLCVPVAAFNSNIQQVCEGSTVFFNNGSYNSPIDTFMWSFPGGTPSTSADENPAIVYNTAGTYDVTLTVGNAAGTNSVTYNGVVIVKPGIGTYGVFPFQESFEGINFPNSEWTIENEGGNTWTQNTFAAKTGITSVYINNHIGNVTGTRDIFYTPSFDLRWVTAASLKFQLAYAIRSSSSTDVLKVYVSTTCGQFWTQRYSKAGAQLTTSGIISSPYFPNSNQWRQETVNIATVQYNNKPNVSFMFEYTHDTGNNMFIDDINVDGTVGINDEFEASLMFNVYPNPTQFSPTVEFTLSNAMQVNVEVFDMLGKAVQQVASEKLDAGDHLFQLPAGMSPGVYTVRLTADGYPVSKKVVIY